MNKYFRRIIAVIPVVLGLVGCGGIPNASPATQIPLAFSPDGMAVANGVIIGANFDGIKESIYTICLLKKSKSPDEQAAILQSPTSFNWTDECAVRDTKRYANNPLLRDVFASTVPTLVATVAKGEMDKSVIRESHRQCDGGPCQGGGPVFNIQTVSQSLLDNKLSVKVGEICAKDNTCGD